MENVANPTMTAPTTVSGLTLLQFVRSKRVANPADVKNAFQAWMRRSDRLPRAINQLDLDDHRKKNHTGRITGTYNVPDLEQVWNQWLDVKRSNHDVVANPANLAAH